MRRFLTIYLCAVVPSMVSGFATAIPGTVKRASSSDSKHFSSIRAGDLDLDLYVHAPNQAPSDHGTNLNAKESTLVYSNYDAMMTAEASVDLRTVGLTQDGADTTRVLLPQEPLTPNRGMTKIGRAGTASPQQLLHSALGVGSLLFGSLHFAHILLHGFVEPITQGEIMVIGSLHVLTAFMGLPRLNWNSKQEAARNSMIWPVPIQNIWYVSAALTEWSQGTECATSIHSDVFAAFTVGIATLALWQVKESFVSGGTNEVECQKSGIWFESPMANAGVTFFSYSGIILLLCTVTLFISQCTDPGQMANYAALHPDHGNVVANLLINSAFINNLAVFGATLVKYKAVTPNQMATAYIPVAFISGLWAIGSGVLADGGQALPDMLQLLAKGTV